MALKKKKNVPVEEVIEEEVAPVEVAEEKEVEVENAWKVENKEKEIKMINLWKAPEEIKKIIQFYWVTSTDLFDGRVDEMWLKDDELKMIKEWYATLI